MSLKWLWRMNFLRTVWSEDLKVGWLRKGMEKAWFVGGMGRSLYLSAEVRALMVAVLWGWSRELAILHMR